MGTSGAFGGSNTKTWKAVAVLAGEATSAPPGATPAADGPPDPQADDRPEDQGTIDDLVSAIAQALQADDPAIRRRYTPKPSAGDSGLFFGTLAGTRSRGSIATPPGGRRALASGASRAGRAISAGYALRNGDAAALSELGLDLGTLAACGRTDQLLTILEELCGAAAGPDDVALRRTVMDELNNVLDGAATDPARSLCDVMAGYVFRLTLVEIEAWATKAGHDSTAVLTLEADIRSYIDVRAKVLDVAAATVVTPAQFEHAAQEILRALLAVLPRGVAR